MNIEFIEATDCQLVEVQVLAHYIWPQVFNEILSPDQLDYMLNLIYSKEALILQKQSGQKFVLLKKNGRFIGYIAYQIFSDKTKIHKLYLLPEMHGKGIGKLMLDYVVKIVDSISQQTIYLNVNKYNKAKLFYEKYGIRVVADEVIDIGNGYVMDDYVMEYR